MAKGKSKDELIAQHVKNLQAIFPEAAKLDPLVLWARLKRIEAEAKRLALAMCNRPLPIGYADKMVLGGGRPL